MTSIEIIPSEHISGFIEIPGSKSYTNRALYLAALTDGPVTIKKTLESDDTKALVDCLNNLGIKTEYAGSDIIVRGSYKDIIEKEYELNANLSGTTIRFILPLLACTVGTKILKGEEGLNKRPIKDLVDSLRNIGANISYEDVEGFPPLKIVGKKIESGQTCAVSGATSSQYLSALLMTAPIMGGLTLKIKNELVSKPYVDMTLDTMNHFGVEVVENQNEYHVPSSPYTASEYVVEGDFSSAGYFFAIAALNNSTLTITNVNPNSLQPDRKIVDVFASMGSKITKTESSITITGAGIVPMEIDMLEFPDQAQTLAVTAGLADGITILKNVHTLRVKETERVKAVETELAKMGIKTESTHDTLKIIGCPTPNSATIDTYGDHRMAMSFAVAGTKLAGMKINNPEVVNKTFPEFWEKLRSINIKITEV